MSLAPLSLFGRAAVCTHKTSQAGTFFSSWFWYLCHGRLDILTPKHLAGKVRARARQRGPATIETKASAGVSGEEEAMLLLGQELCKEASAETILERLMKLQRAFDDEAPTDNAALMFIQAGGLYALFRLLRVTVTSDPSLAPDSISRCAGKALSLLLHSCCQPVLSTYLASAPPAVVPQLVDALRDGPHAMARLAALEALKLLAHAQPAHSRAMAEAGVMEGMLAFFIEVGDVAVTEEELDEAWVAAGLLLRSMLVHSRTIVRDLKQVNSGPQTDQAFTALLILHFSLSGDENEVSAASYHAGFIDTLVATLKHESPFCVTVATIALNSIARSPGCGQALLEGSGALPALVRIIETQPPPGDPEKEGGVYRRTTFKIEVGGEYEVMHWNDPTAMTAGVLCSVVRGSKQRVESFIDAGGVPALVQLLRQSTCPAALMHSAILVQRLVGKPTHYFTKVSDKLFQAGLCRAAIEALRKQIKGTHGILLSMLCDFIMRLTDHFHSAAMAELVTGGVVEFNMAYLASPGQDELGYGLPLFHAFVEDPIGQERICGPGVVDQLIEWLPARLAEAGWLELRMISALLSPLLESRPSFVAAVIKANIIPGLVRLLRMERMRQVSGSDHSGINLPTSFSDSLSCLKQLLRYDMMNRGEHWRSAVSEGIVPIITDCLTIPDEPTIGDFLEVSKLLLMLVPRGEAGQWGGEVVRAIAGLLTSFPPLVRHEAGEILATIGRMHPELDVGCRTYRIGDDVRLLTMPTNPDSVAAPRQSEVMLFFGNQDRDLRRSSAGRHARNHAASTPSPSPNPTLGEQSGTGGANMPVPPSPSAAGTPKRTPRKPSNARKGRAGSGSKPSESADPKVSGTVSSRAGASPGPRAGTKVWACAGCGITAEMAENGKLQECSACGSVRYCGKACQTAHWPAHKPTCKRVRATKKG